MVCRARGAVVLAPCAATLAPAQTVSLLVGVGLHPADGVHPSLAGSYLTACVIYATLTGRSPISRATLNALPRATATELQRTAWTIVSGQQP